jgi:cation:H+ antiporter
MSQPRDKFEITLPIYLALLGAIIATVPALILVASHTHAHPVVGSIVFGFGIFGAAFLLSWAAEAAQIDISESLAVAILALIAVLPEYAVDFVFTWKAAHHPEYAHYAIANMTGANRLLVGLGWPLVLLLYVLARKKKDVRLDESQRVEIFYLAMATLYSFTIPLKGHLTLIDTAILVTLFLLYTRRASQLESPEPEMVGPVKILSNMRNAGRRLATAGLFLYSGLVIFLVAEPFAESLIDAGKMLGLNEFLVVQWLAPLASESPEFIIAATWALRGSAGSALRALISSKVNQWTLLVGTIPLVYAISGRAIHPFLLDNLQIHELVLTAAQSIFGVAVLVNLRLSRTNGVLLAALFLLQFFIEQIRIEVAAAYILLAVIYHILHRKSLIPAAVIGLGLRHRENG